MTSRRRPWQVIYRTSSELADNVHTRSFLTDEEAGEWAVARLRQNGPGAEYSIYVHNKDAGDADPVPAEYRFAWIGGQICVMHWPEMPKQQRAEWTRRLVNNGTRVDWDENGQIFLVEPEELPDMPQWRPVGGRAVLHEVRD